LPRKKAMKRNDLQGWEEHHDVNWKRSSAEVKEQRRKKMCTFRTHRKLK